MDVSVVIPCLNEEETIVQVVGSLVKSFSVSNLQFEIIVVDNGSSDRSVDLAANAGAKVITSEAKTVGAVRNFGVSVTSGTLVAFIDADVVVDTSWASVLERWLDSKLYIKEVVGSHCLVPPTLGGSLGVWFEGVGRDQRNTHLGTGHMIVSREIFDRISGFDELLPTGEDYDFCARLKRIGISIKIDPLLMVWHYGYPANYSEFFRREVWHGLGDAFTLGHILKSKIALAAILFVGLHALGVFLGLFCNVAWLILCWVSAFAVSSLVVWVKFGCSSPQVFVARVAVCYWYLVARFWAIVGRGE